MGKTVVVSAGFWEVDGYTDPLKLIKDLQDALERVPEEFRKAVTMTLECERKFEWDDDVMLGLRYTRKETAEEVKLRESKVVEESADVRRKEVGLLKALMLKYPEVGKG